MNIGSIRHSNVTPALLKALTAVITAVGVASSAACHVTGPAGVGRRTRMDIVIISRAWAAAAAEGKGHTRSYYFFCFDDK